MARDISKYEYLHILPAKQGSGFVVKGYDTYPQYSVLAGQTRISYIEGFDTLAEAKEAYPTATESNEFLEPFNTFDHLPDGPDY